MWECRRGHSLEPETGQVLEPNGSETTVTTCPVPLKALIGVCVPASKPWTCSCFLIQGSRLAQGCRQQVLSGIRDQALADDP